jgi:hypothetical protein
MKWPADDPVGLLKDHPLPSERQEKREDHEPQAGKHGRPGGFEDELARLEAGQQPTYRGEMTRGQQTAWIVGTLILIAFVALGFYLGQDDPRYPGCTGFMGFEDQACKVEHAARRLRGIW